MVNRSFDELVHVVTKIANLDASKVTDLKNNTGITLIDDFSYLTYDDLKAALPGVPVFTLCVLESVAEYVNLGETIENGLDAATICTALRKVKHKPTSYTFSPTRNNIN